MMSKHRSIAARCQMKFRRTTLINKINFKILVSLFKWPAYYIIFMQFVIKFVISMFAQMHIMQRGSIENVHSVITSIVLNRRLEKLCTFYCYKRHQLTSRQQQQLPLIPRPFMLQNNAQLNKNDRALRPFFQNGTTADLLPANLLHVKSAITRLYGCINSSEFYLSPNK